MMRKLLWFVLTLLLLVAALIAFLVLSTGTRTSREALSANAKSLTLLRQAPESASEVGLIPRAAPLYRSARSHPFGQELIRRWEEEPGRRLLPLLLGGSDVVFWRGESGLSYVANPDPVRRLLLRAYLAVAGDAAVPVDIENGLIRVGAAASGGRLSDQTLTTMLRLAGSEPADLYVFQSASSKASYPPIGRPVLTLIFVDPQTIRLRSRAASSGGPAVQSPLPLFFPANAMLVAAASASPEWFEQIDRLVPIGIASFVDRGALMALYRVDDRALMPRVFGVIILPESRTSDDLIRLLESISPRLFLGALGSIEESRRTFKGIEIIRREGFGYTIEYTRTRGQVVISFDKASIEQYLLDTTRQVQLTGKNIDWFVRLRPETLAPVVDQLRNRKELSLLTPDLYETISDLDLWLDYFPGKGSVVIARSREGEFDTVEAVLQAEK